MKYVALVDCNNFFVSCERLFRPDLATKPVVVLSSNDGCVVARSKEVKALGIPMGIPHFKIKDEFAQAGVVVFSSNFPLYRDISARVMRVLKEEAVEVQQYSVDEAFFTITADTDDAALAEIARVKEVVEQRVGIPVSIGAARTKTIAKYAAEVGKRGAGTAVLTGTVWQQLGAELALAEVWGIGRQTSTKMRAAGFTTVADLRAAAPDLILQQFGIVGARLQCELDERPAYHERTEGELQHSIMSTRSFKHSTKDIAVLEDAIAYHVAHVAEELREMDAAAQEVRVLIRTSRHGDWVLRGGTAESLLIAPTADTRLLLKEALALTRRLFEPGVPYKKAGVILGHIVPQDAVLSSLFDDGPTSDHELFDTIDTLNDRFGAGTLTIGRTHRDAMWQASKSHVSPRYTTAWSDIPRVVA